MYIYGPALTVPLSFVGSKSPACWVFVAEGASVDAFPTAPPRTTSLLLSTSVAWSNHFVSGLAWSVLASGG